MCLNKIAEWEFMWQMQFNIDKCFILRVGRPKHKLVHLYTLHNQNLSETDSAKYLGLTITSDLQWNQHINNIIIITIIIQLYFRQQWVHSKDNSNIQG